MADKIATLRIKEPRGLVPVCAEILAMAKAGEIVSACMVYVYADGDVGYSATPTDEFYKTIGAIEHLKQDMLADKTARDD
jgi:hypothetical protein